MIGFTAGIAIGAAVNNNYYYGPYGWHGGAYMYNDAWDDYYDHREDAREDWMDHREDLVEERGDRREDLAEERGDRAGASAGTAHGATAEPSGEPTGIARPNAISNAAAHKPRRRRRREPRAREVTNPAATLRARIERRLKSGAGPARTPSQAIRAGNRNARPVRAERAAEPAREGRAAAAEEEDAGDSPSRHRGIAGCGTRGAVTHHHGSKRRPANVRHA